MEISGAGMSASAPGPPVANAISPPANLLSTLGLRAVSGDDSIGPLLGELSQSNLTRLLKLVDAPLPDSEVAKANGLLRDAADAVVHQDTGRALDVLRQFAGMLPLRAETLALSPELTPIRSEVERLLAQLTAEARLHAEGRLVEASQRLGTASLRDTPASDVRPEVLLLVAGKLLEAGGLANYVRSAAVSTALLDPAQWVPAPVASPVEANAPSAGWQASWKVVMLAWIGFGTTAIALCWYLREDYLPLACIVWAAGLGLLIALRRGLR